MKGFDNEFTDFVDYILRITDIIWKEKNIGAISRYYGKNSVIHTLGGPVYGSDAVINGTIKTLAAFPDRLLNAEDVIWTGNDDDGYYSSHRIISPDMTNSGHSEFGPPTGRMVSVRTIADCAAKDNEIYEEWLMRDNMAIVQQLGVDPHALAKQLANDNREDDALHTWLATEIERVSALTDSTLTTSLPSPKATLNDFVHCVLRNLWCEQNLDLIRSAYSEKVRFHGPSGRELNGHAGVQQYMTALLSCLSDRHVSIDHICSVARQDNECVVAVRWVLVGTHTNDGLYGTATNKRIMILAASHWHIKNDRIIEEWTVFDELAVLRQLY